MDTEIIKRKEEVDGKIAKVQAVVDRIDVVLICGLVYRLSAWELDFMNSVKEQLEVQISRRIPTGLSAKQRPILIRIERIAGVAGL